MAHTIWHYPQSLPLMALPSVKKKACSLSLSLSPSLLGGNLFPAPAPLCTHPLFIYNQNRPTLPHLRLGLPFTVPIPEQERTCVCLPHLSVPQISIAIPNLSIHGESAIAMLLHNDPVFLLRTVAISISIAIHCCMQKLPWWTFRPRKKVYLTPTSRHPPGPSAPPVLETPCWDFHKKNKIPAPPPAPRTPPSPSGPEQKKSKIYPKRPPSCNRTMKLAAQVSTIGGF